MAAAAGLIIFLGLGFVTLRYFDRSAQQDFIQGDPTISETIPTVAPIKNIETIKQTEIKQTEVAAKTIVKDIQPVKAVTRHQPVNVKQTLAKNAVIQKPVAPVTTAPVLSNYEAEDDNSLRLADLFADIDSQLQ